MNSKLREQLLRLMRYANTLTPYKLDEPLDPFVDDAFSETEKAIRQAVGEELLELVGKDDYSERNGLVGLTHRDETRNELKAELRQKIKQWAALKEPS